MASQTEWTKDVKVVRPEKAQRAKQDFDALFGVNEISTPSRHISMLVTMFKPGEYSNAHYHLDHESALYGVSGSIHMFYGDELENEVKVSAGDFIYIPPFCRHKSYNRSHTEDAVFVTARTDALEQERVVVVHEIDDGRCDARVDYLD
jgi:uncharacterized RmlC-like cupin family protein